MPRDDLDQFGTLTNNRAKIYVNKTRLRKANEYMKMNFPKEITVK